MQQAREQETKTIINILRPRHPLNLLALNGACVYLLVLLYGGNAPVWVSYFAVVGALAGLASAVWFFQLRRASKK